MLFPPFRLDLLSEKLWRGMDVIPLRPKTFAILRYLAEHPERLVSKAELLQAIWGETHVSEEGLRDYIREIRKALSDSAESPRFVETALGRGYRFIAPLTITPIAANGQYPVVSRTEDNGNDQQEKKNMTPSQTTSPALVTLRGIYDGKEFRALPTESLPFVHRETSVLIVFLGPA
jgi:DNA-binding winged helix-turn-helix (wHTH) protein